MESLDDLRKVTGVQVDYTKSYRIKNNQRVWKRKL